MIMLLKRAYASSALAIELRILISKCRVRFHYHSSKPWLETTLKGEEIDNIFALR